MKRSDSTREQKTKVLFLNANKDRTGLREFSTWLNKC